MTENNAAQPGLTDAEILHRWDIYVSEPCASYPLTDSDKIDFARAIESALLSKLRAEGVQAGDDYAPHHDQPHQTGVGEWCAPGPAAEQRQAWLLRFADADRGDCVYYDEQEARRAFAQSEGRGWNCYLFEYARRAALASAPVAATRGPVKERADFAIWLTRTFPSLYTSADAARFLDDGHQASLAWQAHWTAGAHISTLASAPVAGEAQPVCWIYRTHLESLRDDGADEASVYRGDAGRAIGPDEVPLYAAPQASEAVCSCPTGDGSLRHPCAVHPPGNKDGGDCAKGAGDEQSIELASLRDMLEEARAEIELVRESLGVPYEPHQTLFDRILDACDAQKSAEAYRKIDNARGILEWLDTNGRVVGMTLHADRPGHWQRSLPDGAVKSGELVQHLQEIVNDEAAGRAALSPTQPTEQGERDA
jgi:hypothetical protein